MYDTCTYCEIAYFTGESREGMDEVPSLIQTFAVGSPLYTVGQPLKSRITNAMRKSSAESDKRRMVKSLSLIHI